MGLIKVVGSQKQKNAILTSCAIYLTSSAKQIIKRDLQCAKRNDHSFLGRGCGTVAELRLQNQAVIGSNDAGAGLFPFPPLLPSFSTFLNKVPEEAIM